MHSKSATEPGRAESTVRTRSENYSTSAWSAFAGRVVEAYDGQFLHMFKICFKYCAGQITRAWATCWQAVTHSAVAQTSPV